MVYYFPPPRQLRQLATNCSRSLIIMANLSVVLIITDNISYLSRYQIIARPIVMILEHNYEVNFTTLRFWFTVCLHLRYSLDQKIRCVNQSTMADSWHPGLTWPLIWSTLFFHFIRCPCCFVSYNCLTSINCSDYVWNISSYKELRICHLCNTTDRGDEFHYLLKFDYFNGKRKTCIDKKKYLKNGSILKFGTLMNLTKKIQNIKTMHFYKKY